MHSFLLSLVGQVGIEPTVFLMSRFYRPLQSPAMHTDPYGGERRTRTQCRMSWHDPLSRRSSDLPSSLSVWLGWMDLNHRVPVSETSALPLGDTPIQRQGLGDWNAQRWDGVTAALTVTEPPLRVDVYLLCRLSSLTS